jgi:hypothetical protein
VHQFDVSPFRPQLGGGVSSPKERQRPSRVTWPGMLMTFPGRILFGLVMFAVAAIRDNVSPALTTCVTGAGLGGTGVRNVRRGGQLPEKGSELSMPKGIKSSPEFRAQATRRAVLENPGQRAPEKAAGFFAAEQRPTRGSKIIATAGLVPCHRAPWRHLTQASGTPPAPDLACQDFAPTRPGVRFVGDITQINTSEGPVFLATVIDRQRGLRV